MKGCEQNQITNTSRN